MATSMSPPEMAGDVPTVGIATSDWYAPGSYSYTHPYASPFPSSTVSSQPFAQGYTRASIPDINISSYAILQSQAQPHHSPSNAPGRPRSSPSTFGPLPDAINWAATSGLGIQYPPAMTQPMLATSTFPPSYFQTYPIDGNLPGATSPPEIRQPQPRRPYTSIAPNPAQVAAQKRWRDEEPSDSPGSGKRRKRTSSVVSADLSEDDRFLVQLKEEESLPWKDIASRFQTDKGKQLQVAALQMRYKRLREKFRQWDDQDLLALKLAHEYWEKYKWEIVAAKMLDFGVAERWPARYCARKWQDMDGANSAMPPATAGATPLSHMTSSPTESQAQYSFMPPTH